MLPLPCARLFADAGFSALLSEAAADGAGAGFVASLVEWCELDSCSFALRSNAGTVDERTGGELGGELRLFPGFETSAASFARPVGGCDDCLAFDSDAAPEPLGPLVPAAFPECWAPLDEAFGALGCALLVG